MHYKIKDSISPLVSETRLFPAGSDYRARCGCFINPEDSEDVIDFTIFNLIYRQLFLEALSSLHSFPPIRLSPFFSLLSVAPFRSGAILKELAVNGVPLLTYPPHMLHIFQVLDLLLFGTLKRSRKDLPIDDVRSVTAFMFESGGYQKNR
jgi:hypothetical protein